MTRHKSQINYWKIQNRDRSYINNKLQLKSISIYLVHNWEECKGEYATIPVLVGFSHSCGTERKHQDRFTTRLCRVLGQRYNKMLLGEMENTILSWKPCEKICGGGQTEWNRQITQFNRWRKGELTFQVTGAAGAKSLIQDNNPEDGDSVMDFMFVCVL